MQEELLNVRKFRLPPHLIAVAELNGELRLYLDILVTSGTATNLITIAMHGLPCGSGRKGGEEKNKRKGKEKIVSHKSVKDCVP